MDLDPNKQSYHKTAETHPVVRVIIFFVEAASGVAQSPFDMLSALFGLMDNGEEDETTFGSVLSDLFSFLGEIIKWVKELLIDFLEAVGQINRAVDDKIYGCVNLPLGPMPPPFCPTIEPFYQVAQTQRICHINPFGDPNDPEDGYGYGYPVKSVSGNECVVSLLRNNFVSNSIRVGYKNFVPLCKANEDPMKTDKCVIIDNWDAFTSAQGMHTSTARRDIIKPCKTATDGATAAKSGACVRTSIEHKCSVSN